MRCDFYLFERNIITFKIYSESQGGFIIMVGLLLLGRVYYYYYFFTRRFFTIALKFSFQLKLLLSKSRHLKGCSGFFTFYSILLRNERLFNRSYFELQRRGN